jgi:hypothetical protein
MSEVQLLPSSHPIGVPVHTPALHMSLSASRSGVRGDSTLVAIVLIMRDSISALSKGTAELTELWLHIDVHLLHSGTAYSIRKPDICSRQESFRIK